MSFDAFDERMRVFETAHAHRVTPGLRVVARLDGRNFSTLTKESDAFDGKGTAWKNELLFRRGVNFSDLPAWQKRGVGLWWETTEKPGVDPRTGTPAVGTRRRIHRELELPVGDAWTRLLGRLAAGRA